MMYQRPGDRSTRWGILRTSPGRTLALAASLAAAGVEAWTPKRTFKRARPGRCQMIDGRKPTVEIDAPILPTFVLVRAAHLDDMKAEEVNPASQHPAFSVFRYGGAVPEVRDQDVAGLRQEEAREAALLEDLRAAESREEKRRIRAAAAQNKRERRRALMAEKRHFTVGAHVTVGDAPMLAGMTGVVTASDGRSAVVAFGGSLVMEIEAWRLALDAVQDAPSMIAAAK